MFDCDLATINYSDVTIQGFNLCRLGRGHMNYNIQIIIVILKMPTRFFWRRPWIIDNDLGLLTKLWWYFYGHTSAKWTTRLLCVPPRWSSLNRKWRRHRIIGTFIMIVLRSHMFSAKFTIIVFGAKRLRRKFSSSLFWKMIMIISELSWSFCGQQQKNLVGKKNLL